MFELHIHEEHWVAQISILRSKNLSLSSSKLKVEIAFKAQFHASLLLLGQQLVWDDVQIGLEFLQAGPLRCHINVVEAVVVYAKPYGKAWQGMARHGVMKAAEVGVQVVIKDESRVREKMKQRWHNQVPNTRCEHEILVVYTLGKVSMQWCSVHLHRGSLSIFSSIRFRCLKLQDALWRTRRPHPPWWGKCPSTRPHPRVSNGFWHCWMGLCPSGRWKYATSSPQICTNPWHVHNMQCVKLQHVRIKQSNNLSVMIHDDSMRNDVMYMTRSPPGLAFCNDNRCYVVLLSLEPIFPRSIRNMRLLDLSGWLLFAQLLSILRSSFHHVEVTLWEKLLWRLRRTEQVTSKKVSKWLMW